MGQEIECTMRYSGRTLRGTAYLETDHILFRGQERVKIALRELRGVEAADGVLRLALAGGPAELELGNVAEKWAAKILRPPSRADKLGLKDGATVRLVGKFADDFREELRGCRVVARGAAELVFLAAERREELVRLEKLAGSLAGSAALWIVYPKGKTEIRETEVIAAGRAAGLKDVKVAAFSKTHTALKFVVPVAAR